MKEPRTVLYASAITGLCAVAAATAAAHFSTAASRDSIKVEGQRAREAATSQARGAARVLITELNVSGEEIREMADAGEFSMFSDEYGIAVPYEDIRLIAGQLEPGQWRIVSRAIDRTRSLGRYIDKHAQDDEKTIPPNTMAVIHDDAREIDAAVHAVEPLAGIDRGRGE